MKPAEDESKLGISPPMRQSSDAGSRGGRFYNPALDGLRFIAFLGVFIHHAVQGDPAKYEALHFLPRAIITWIPTASRSFGGAGVDLFFVLSAYLITTLLVLEKDRAGSIDALAFYFRRTLRIWPLYFAVLLVLWSSQQFWKPHLPATYFVASALFLGNWALAAFKNGSPGPVTPLWSVSVEEQYYLVWPWVVARFKPPTLSLIGWTIVFACVAVRFGLWTTGASYNEMSANTFARMAPLGLGVVLAVNKRLRMILVRLPLPLLWLGLSAAAIIVLERPTAFGEIPSFYTAVIKYPASALICMLMVGVLLRADSERIPVISSPIVVYLGRISYGLYMFHALAMEFVYHFSPSLSAIGGKFAKGLVTFPAILLLTVGAASLSYHFFERPFLSLKDRYARVKSGMGGQ